MFLTARSYDHPKSPTTSCTQAFAAVPTSISPRAAETCSKHNHNHRNGLPPGMTAKNHQRQFVHHDYHDHSLELPDNKVELALFSAYHHDSNDRSDHDDHQFEGVTTPFPIKLYEMLDKIENDGHSNIISWQPHGRCFLIHNPKNFVNTIIHKYFRQTKLSSFRRQLNLYGFSRLTTGPDKGAYYHELFLRDRPFLIHRMVRTRIKGTGIRTASSPDTEPDFYGMPPMPSIGELIRLKQEGKEYHYQEHEQHHPKIRIPDALQSTRRREGKRRGVLHKDVSIQISPIKSSLLSSSPLPPPSPETKAAFIPPTASIPSHSAKKIPQIPLSSSKTKPKQEETKTTTRKLSPSPIPSPSSTSNKNSQNQNRRWSMGNITDKEQADEDITLLPVPLFSSSPSISLLSISSNIPDQIPFKSRESSSSSFKVEEEDLTPLQFDTAEVDDKCLIDFINNLELALDCTDLATLGKKKNNMSSSVGMMLDADIMDDRNLDYLIDKLLD